MELFDSHLHLDDAAFDADRPAVIARAREAGVVNMVTVGTRGWISSAIGRRERARRRSSARTSAWRGRWIGR